MADRTQPERRKGARGVKRADPRRQQRPTGARPAPPPDPEMQVLALGRKNWILMGAGGVSILAGFGLLATGDITVAPILLLAGYLVLIPIGLVSGSFREHGEADASEE